MLSELEELQQSDESVWSQSMTIEIETRSKSDNELIHKEYTFSYADQFDKWMFSEYVEKRTRDTPSVTERNWRKSRHLFWQDGEAASIDVPPEVSQSLADATGSESVTIQTPAGSVDEQKYKQYVCD